MLSTAYRLRLIAICNRIKNGEEVGLSDIIWVEKLSKSNKSAAGILRKARRIAIQGKGENGSLDEFLQNMDLGFADPNDHRTGFDGADDDEMRRD